MRKALSSGRRCATSKAACPRDGRAGESGEAGYRRLRDSRCPGAFNPLDIGFGAFLHAELSNVPSPVNHPIIAVPSGMLL